jgi:AraC-like DNA-binding protein
MPVHSHTHLLMELGKTLSFAGPPGADLENNFYLNLGLALLTGHALAVQANLRVPTPGEQALSRAKQFILKEFGRSLLLKDLAAAAKVSIPQLMKLFQNELGASPIQYLYKQRLWAAAEKLAHTGLAIKEIAQSCGFANEFHFSRKFKEAYGMSPRAWRRQEWAQPTRKARAKP